MKLPRRQFLHLAAGAAGLPALSRVARAQAYPTKPVRNAMSEQDAEDLIASLRGGLNPADREALRRAAENGGFSATLESRLAKVLPPDAGRPRHISTIRERPETGAPATSESRSQATMAYWAGNRFSLRRIFSYRLVRQFPLYCTMLPIAPPRHHPKPFT